MIMNGLNSQLSLGNLGQAPQTNSINSTEPPLVNLISTAEKLATPALYTLDAGMVNVSSPVEALNQLLSMLTILLTLLASAAGIGNMAPSLAAQPTLDINQSSEANTIDENGDISTAKQEDAEITSTEDTGEDISIMDADWDLVLSEHFGLDTGEDISLQDADYNSTLEDIASNSTNVNDQAEDSEPETPPSNQGRCQRNR
jgi:hypothetical protein